MQPGEGPCVPKPVTYVCTVDTNTRTSAWNLSRCGMSLVLTMESVSAASVSVNIGFASGP